jgi:hypothetical protein
MVFERFPAEFSTNLVSTMKNLLAILVFLSILGACASAQVLQGRFVTSAYGWERQDTVGSSSNHLYGYQTVQLSITQGDYTVSTYLQGWNDFAGPLKNQGKIRLYNLYFKWRNIADLGELTLGRQAVFAGVGVGTIDGINATARLLENKVKLVGYAGPLAPADLGAQPTDNLWDNAMYGGQVVVAPIDEGQVSVSYMKRNLQPQSYMATRYDPNTGPYLTEIRPSASNEEYVSADASGEYEFVYGYLRYDHDLLLEKMSRFQFFTRVKPVDRIGVTAEYVQREPRVSYNSIFSAFVFNTLKDVELGLEYEIPYVSDLQVFGKYGQVNYGDETSTQLTGGASWKYVSASAAIISGYNGKVNAASVNAGYPLFDNMITPTVNFTYGRYKLSEYDLHRSVALSGAFGVVYRPVPVFSVDTQVQWIQNKIYKNDVRLFLRASYLLNERLSLF